MLFLPRWTGEECAIILPLWQYRILVTSREAVGGGGIGGEALTNAP